MKERAENESRPGGVRRLELRGDAKEVGRAYGRRMAEAIRSNASIYHTLYGRLGGYDDDDIRRRADAYAGAMAKYTPTLMREIEGIAEGAQLPLETVVALNARTELMFNADTPGFSECSTFFVGPNRSHDGHTYIGQNWDFFHELQGNGVILDITNGDGSQQVVTFTEVGLVGKIGLNSAGLAVCVDLLISSSYRDAIGVPMHAVLRRLLDRASTVEGAAYMFASVPRTLPFNCLVADRTGRCVSLESTGDVFEVRHPEDGLLAHSNAYQAPRMRPLDVLRKALPDATVRSQRLTCLLSELGNGVDVSGIQAALRNHDGHPNSICRHPVPGAENGLASLASIIMDIDDREMYVTDGPPCEGEYGLVRLHPAPDPAPHARFLGRAAR